MEIHPNAFATELIRMIAAKIGQRYLIMKLNIFFLWNVPPSKVTSSSIFSTPMTLEISRQAFQSALDINVGAQDCSVHESGAFTGEVSAGMLADVKCPWVIVGHSERRQYHGESNEIVAAKAKIAIEHGLRPIVCVGETLEERESGRTSDVVIGQLNAVLDAVGPEALVTGAVAYEPVWAIGTGKTATPQQAQLVHAELRDSVESRDSQAASALRIIYGGSVKPSNAAELFACNDIDGGLVGGASLK